jgi:hypothetical protein
VLPGDYIKAQSARMHAARQPWNSLGIWAARLIPRPFCASFSIAFDHGGEARLLGCYVIQLQAGWVEINSGYRMPGRLDLLSLPAHTRLFEGHFLPPQGAEIFIDALSPEQSRRPIFSAAKGRRLITKITLGIGGPSGLLKEKESAMVDLDVYGRSVPDRYVISRITVGTTPIEADLRFRSDDSRANELISAFRSTLDSLSKLPNRKCTATPNL